jgi:hypothetical protein
MDCSGFKCSRGEICDLKGGMKTLGLNPVVRGIGLQAQYMALLLDSSNSMIHSLRS